MVVDFSERMRRILGAVVEDYMDTAEPVGSKLVANKLGLNLSPATIRSIMSELEELGLLFQPHTSAGRVPTEKGLRFYVDYLLDIHELNEGERGVIRSRYLGYQIEAEDLSREDFPNSFFLFPSPGCGVGAEDELDGSPAYRVHKAEEALGDGHPGQPHGSRLSPGG